MNTVRRKFLHLAAGAAALPALSHIPRAQTGPADRRLGTRVITLGNDRRSHTESASGAIFKPANCRWSLLCRRRR
jgi:hypothetical protein